MHSAAVGRFEGSTTSDFEMYCLQETEMSSQKGLGNEKRPFLIFENMTGYLASSKG